MNPTKKLLKEMFGTTSTKKISTEQVSTQIGSLYLHKANKDISKTDFKTRIKLLKDLLADVNEIEQEKKEEARILGLPENWEAVKRDKKRLAWLAKESARARSELLNIVVDTEDDTPRKFHVSYICMIRWMTNEGDKVRQALISEDIRITASSSERTKIFKAFEVYKEKNANLLGDMYDAEAELMSWKNVLIVDLLKESNVKLVNVGMGHINMSYVDFKDLPSDFISADNKCVIDYLMYESASSGRKRWTHAYLEGKLGLMPSTQDILDFAKEEVDVSVYALDMYLNVFAKHVPENNKMSLFFICNNKHLYPILDQSIRKSITQKGRIDFEDMKVQFKDFEDEAVEYIEADTNIVLNSEAKHVIVDTDNLKEIAVQVMRDTNVNIPSWKIFNHNVVGFKHPTKNQIVSAGTDYNDRKMVCEKEFNEKQLADFKFVNQGYGQISRSMYENRFGVVPSSDYSPEMKMILKDHASVPYRMCSDKGVKNAKSMDIHKCYSSILFENKYDYPIHSGFDIIEPCMIKSIDDLVAGQYYIKHTVYAGIDGSIKVSKGWYQYELVTYLIRIKVVKLVDVTFCMKARSVLKASSFKPFVEYVYGAYDSKIAKNLINTLVGCFGSLYYRHEDIGVTNDWETCVSALNQYANKKMKFNEIDNLYVIQMIDEQMKNGGDMTIYRSVIGQSIIALDKMTRAIYIPGKTQIVGYNTDAVKFTGKYNKEACSKFMGGFELEKCKTLMGYSMDELDEFPEYSLKEININVEHDTPMSERSELRLGAPGCGKSYGLSKWYKEGDVVLCYTNACCEQLKKYGVEAHTFESYTIDASTGNPSTSKFSGATRVALDEYKTLPPNFMSLLLNAKEKYKFQLVCLGDYNQTKAPCDNWIEYHSNRRFLEALDFNVVYMTYNVATGRYDNKLNNALVDFVATGVLNIPSRNTIVSDYNICYTNSMRRHINGICLKRWVHKTGSKLTELNGKKNKKNYTLHVAVGLEMMVYDENDLVNKVYKTHRYKITEINEKTIIVSNGQNNVEYVFERFVEIFDYSFAYTMYKIQGITIDKPFNIWEAEHMSFNELYTAVSRAKRFDDVHIDRLSLIRYVHDEVSTVSMKLQKAEEHIGRIYLITFNDNSAYIGQTQLSIYERFGQHLVKATNESMRVALENRCPKLELLEETKFTNINSLRDLEESYIDKFRDIFTLLNKQHNSVAKVTKERLVKPKVKYSIKDEPDSKRYYISYTNNGKYLKKRFSYALCSKELAFNDATKWRNEKCSI